ncbi:hypothetical protein CRUP_019863 [Coryphaenoides rupestris]|nr:hypothetical protein CRUP_019863 [Coryphaenoides rupestris]
MRSNSRCPSQERPGSCCTPPAMDLSLSPSTRHHASSPSSSFSPCPPSPTSPLGSPLGSPLPYHFSREPSNQQYIEGRVSPHGYPFYLPIKSQAGRYNFPSSVFIGQTRESPEPPSLDEQLSCHWMKCHLQFDTLQELVDHINDHHVKPEKDSGYKMLIHIRTHTNEKPHHCPTCNKSFSRLENLKIHTRSHTGEKPYICPYEGCSKRYSNSSDRFKHTRTHYVDKPYRCKMAGCHKRYTDPSSLRKHIKAHGHFVAPEHHSAAGRGAATSRAAAWPGHPGSSRGAEGEDLPFVGRAHVIIPGAAAAALLGGLGASLPLSALCRVGAFGRTPDAPPMSLGSARGGRGAGGRPVLSLTPDSFHPPIGLSAASLLGLHPPLVAREGVGEEGEEEEEGRREGRVLNLSVGLGAGVGDTLPWLMVPPAAFLLRPVVGS